MTLNILGFCFLHQRQKINIIIIIISFNFWLFQFCGLIGGMLGFLFWGLLDGDYDDAVVADVVDDAVDGVPILHQSDNL